MSRLSLLLASFLMLSLAGCGALTPMDTAAPAAPRAEKLRLGFFANITHAQALVGIARGDFQKALGDVKLEAKCFNAGPSAVEAIFAGEIDVTYIGPSPALNAFIKSRGKAVRIVSGSALNGVAVVVSKGSGITRLEQLKGRKIATPQFGNTQDISARHYLLKTLGAQLKDAGGGTEISPIANADQLNLFKQGQLDAAWAPEPWAARMVHEAGGSIVAEEKDLWADKRFCTAVVVASEKFLSAQPELVETFLRSHLAVTDWINANREQAAEAVNAELKNQAGKALSPAVLKDAFARVEFTTDPAEESVRTFAAWSQELGMTKDLPGLKPLFALSILEKIQGGAAK